MAGWSIWAPHEHAIHTCPLSKPPSRSPHRLWSSTKATRAGDRKRSGPSSSGDDRVSRPRCTIRTRGQHHLEASVGPGGIPQCWRSGMPGRLHIWRTHPADLHPGRAQGDLRAQRRLMVQGRLGGWLLRASVSSLVREGRARRGHLREGDPSPSGGCRVCPQPPG